MSQFMPEKQEGERGGREKWPPERGPEEFLTADERQFLRRYFGHPEDLPPEFQSWLIDLIAVNIPQIPVSQLVGFKQIEQTEVRSATNNASTGSITSTSYGSEGPSLTGLRNGTYVLTFGALVSPGAVAETGRVSVAINGAAPSDDDAVWFNGTSPAEVGVSRAVEKTLNSNDANTVGVQFRSTGGQSVAFSRRWLLAQRIGPVAS